MNEALPRKPRYGLGAVAGVILMVSLTGCQNANSIAMKIGKPSEATVKLRVKETRRYDTTDEAVMLSAASQTLQDLGFTLTESAVDVGVLVASKQRDAEETGEIAGQVALTIALALLGTHHQPDWDQDQTIVVTISTTPVGSSHQTDVRANFARTIRTARGKFRSEHIDDPKIYQEFFARLSGGVFLEGHEI